MIRPLRRYHYYLWRVLAILLPVLFILAILWRPSPPVKGKGLTHQENVQSNNRNL
jgi:hypothetical protein